MHEGILEEGVPSKLLPVPGQQVPPVPGGVPPVWPWPGKPGLTSTQDPGRFPGGILVGRGSQLECPGLGCMGFDDDDDGNDNNNFDCFKISPDAHESFLREKAHKLWLTMYNMSVRKLKHLPSTIRYGARA